MLLNLRLIATNLPLTCHYRQAQVQVSISLPETQVGAKMEQPWPLLVFLLGPSLDLGGEEGGHSLSRENETGVA